MEKVYAWPPVLLDVKFSFCPGCTHGIAHKLIAEVIGELGIEHRTIGVDGNGCSNIVYMNIDNIFAAHGRGPALATGLKACRPDEIVFSYQGDGDCSSIGAAEIIHAAGRSENITVFMINNGVFAMTGGQKAPTTLLGQKTTTTQNGREARRDGFPIKEAELLAAVPGSAYIARGSLHDPQHVAEAKEYIRKAFQTQMDGKGFSFVELLSACPTNWGLSPVEALQRVKNEMIPYFPVGEILVDGERV